MEMEISDGAGDALAVAVEEAALVVRELSWHRITVAAQAVSRGAALLDAKRPGWVSEIQWSALELEDPLYCILGQLYGDYVDGFSALRNSGPADLTESQFAQLYGFSAAPPWETELEAAWLALAVKRLGVPLDQLLGSRLQD